MISRVELRELRNVIEEARVILRTTPLPPGRALYARELIESAVKQVDAMLATPTVAMLARKHPSAITIKR
jgi:hypothetical protein